MSPGKPAPRGWKTSWRTGHSQRQFDFDDYGLTADFGTRLDASGGKTRR